MNRALRHVWHPRLVKGLFRTEDSYRCWNMLHELCVWIAGSIFLAIVRQVVLKVQLSSGERCLDTVPRTSCGIDKRGLCVFGAVLILHNWSAYFRKILIFPTYDVLKAPQATVSSCLTRRSPKSTTISMVKLF